MESPRKIKEDQLDFNDNHGHDDDVHKNDGKQV